MKSRSGWFATRWVNLRMQRPPATLTRGTATPHRIIDAIPDGDSAAMFTDSATEAADGRIEDAASSQVDASTCQPGTPGCVQCRPETEEADCRAIKSCDPSTENCEGTSCDPKSSTCARQLRGTIKQCEPCVSDSECIADHRCMELSYGTGAARQALGGFCLKRAATGCVRPFGGLRDKRESISGYPAELYCGPNEAVTTCAAIQAFVREGRLCDGTDESCGAIGARCETLSGAIPNVCLIGCMTANLECPENFVCQDSDAGRFCDRPPVN
jgi:hypothetical protein